MNLRRLLQITAVLGMVFSVGFVLVPDRLWSLYGLRLDAGGLFEARMFGATTLGLALTVLLTMPLWTPALERAFAKALMAWTLVGGIVILTAQLQSVMNALGWGYVGLNLAFVAAYAYVLFVKPTAEQLAR